MAMPDVAADLPALVSAIPADRFRFLTADRRRFGEPSRLLLLHLRDARISDVRTDRVVGIENETTFNNYTEEEVAR